MAIKLVFFLIMLSVGFCSVSCADEHAKRMEEEEKEKERNGIASVETKVTDWLDKWSLQLDGKLIVSSYYGDIFTIVYALNRSNVIPEDCESADIIIKRQEYDRLKFDAVEEGEAISYKVCSYNNELTRYVGQTAEGQVTISRNDAHYQSI